MSDSAKDTVLNAIFVLKKALEFYADSRNYDIALAAKPVQKDKGELARKALAMLDKL